MTPPDFAAFLARTLDDRSLSRGEQSALAAWLAANAKTEQARGAARHAVFAAARGAVATRDAAEVFDWLDDALKVFAAPPPAPAPAAAGTAEAFFSPGPDCLARITHRFAAARKTADVCVFTITDDRITRSILDAHRRGVSVRIITDNEKEFDQGSDVAQLRAAGVPLRVDRTPFHMHHKFAIFDGTRLLNGSYNWTRGAADQNEENVIDTPDPALVAAFAAHFAALWAALG